eukprot:maker-scaffold288_size220435-snap-gene-1.20 protein:Tk01467 transcript:maker-scaffold288_size220435-snap-gene-1.20-mRNA-1 annotation:"ATPase"
MDQNWLISKDFGIRLLEANGSYESKSKGNFRFEDVIQGTECIMLGIMKVCLGNRSRNYVCVSILAVIGLFLHLTLTSDPEIGGISGARRHKNHVDFNHWMTNDGETGGKPTHKALPFPNEKKFGLNSELEKQESKSPYGKRRTGPGAKGKKMSGQSDDAVYEEYDEDNKDEDEAPLKRRRPKGKHGSLKTKNGPKPAFNDEYDAPDFADLPDSDYGYDNVSFGVSEGENYDGGQDNGEYDGEDDDSIFPEGSKKSGPKIRDKRKPLGENDYVDEY